MRIDFDVLKEIVETLSRNKSRTLLTGFGIFWGVFMLLVMLGGGDGLKALLSKNFEGFTANTVIVSPAQTSKPYGGFKRDRTWMLDRGDIEMIRTLVPETDVVTPMTANWGGSATYDKYTYNSAIIKGMEPAYIKVEAPEMLYGRWINDVDQQQGRKVCVLGERVWKNLFPNEEDPTGKYITIANTSFLVVGVDVHSSNISINGSSDESIVIPQSLMDRLYNKGGKYEVMCFTLKDGVDSEAVQEKIRSLLYRKHTIDPTDKDAMMMLDTQKIFSIVDSLFKGVDILILLVGLGTLLAGAIGVSNIMMVTVKERTTEIGIRRAIGATPKMILSQIMAESVGLTMSAGMLGILFSVFVLWAAGKAVTATADMGTISFQLGFWTGIGALLLLVVLGITAGMAPALRAMNIKPVDAMRDE